MSTRILHNISWLTLGNVVAKPLWLGFITFVCIRVLGDEGYGIFTATLFLTAIAHSFSDLGITQYTVREVARSKRHAARFFSNFVAAKVLLDVLAIGAALVVGLLLDYRGDKMTALFFAGCYTVALGLTEYCRSFYRASERMKYEAFSVIVEKLLVIGFGSALLLYFRTPAAVLGGMAVGMFLTLVLNLAWTTRRLAAFHPKLLSRRFVFRALPAAFTLGLASQFVVIYFRTDAVMVDAMAGEAAAGQYGAAYRLLEASMLLATMITTVVFPRLSSLFKARRSADFTNVFRKSTLGVTGIGLTIAVGLYLAAHPLMMLINGDASFAPAADALQLLAWAAPFMCMNGLLSIALSASDDQRVLATILGAAALLNLSLNFVLIPQFSFFGACASTLVTEAAVSLMLALRYYRHVRPSLVAIA